MNAVNRQQQNDEVLAIFSQLDRKDQRKMLNVAKFMLGTGPLKDRFQGFVEYAACFGARRAVIKLVLIMRGKSA